MEPTADRVSPEQALAIYAETLVSRGVVAVFGDSSAGVGELLLRLGARAVYVWDPDPGRALGRAAAAPRGLTVRRLAREDLGRRDFDVALVPDLGLFDDPGGLLADIRKMVGEEGVAIVTARNSEASGGSEGRSFDYYALFDAVAAEFDFARMVAQLPFYGLALVELGEDGDTASGVSVDTQLGEDGPPDAFVVLGSQRDVRLDPYVLVQLAMPGGLELAALATAPADEDRTDAALVAQLAELAELPSLRARAQEANALEGALADRNRKVSALTREAEDLRVALEAGRLAAAEEIDELIARVDRAERRALEQERELAQMEAEGSAVEHEAIEERLRERAQVIRDLENELARRDRLVRDLAGALEEANVAPPAQTSNGDGGEAVAELRRRLDAMALDLARREGEAQAAAWSIQELERRLEIAERGPPPAPAEPTAPAAQAKIGASPASDAAARLGLALDEIDALRAALVQEHEARVRAESRFAGVGTPPEVADQTPHAT
jgi:hypothetical protein